MTTTLRCEMNAACEHPVTHIDDSGFIYCASHGESRKAHRRCRKLRLAELRRLERGEKVERY